MAFNSQNGGGLFRSRIVLVVLLVVSIALITVYSREGQHGPLHAVQVTMGEVFAPLKLAGAGVSSGAEAAQDALTDATADENSLTQLRESNAELRELVAQTEEYRQEAQRLQALLDMNDRYGVEGVSARVVGKSATAWNQTITINVGRAEGVEAGMTVMGASGVVGQVAWVAEHSSEVRLLSDSQSGAAAMVQSSRAEGIVRGSLEGLLYLQDVDESSSVAVGDVVITSGLGGSYVSGLMIGTVVRVDAGEGGTPATIVVSPNADVDALEEVTVVFQAGSTGAGSGANDADEAGEGAAGDAAESAEASEGGDQQ